MLLNEPSVLAEAALLNGASGSSNTSQKKPHTNIEADLNGASSSNSLQRKPHTHIKPVNRAPTSPLKRLHPYLAGNFAPIHKTLPLTPCTYTGTIPRELAGGQYVRNGGNPLTNTDISRSSHWFDGDGMLSGVFFPTDASGRITPQFTNQYVLTDVFLSAATTPGLKEPILPSIATLVNPASTFWQVQMGILRAVALAVLSHLPGSKQKIKKISVGNTNVLYHDGRALATCEAGPPMRIALPGLETIGWFDGLTAEGEAEHGMLRGQKLGNGQWMKEWTTAHPKVDSHTGELVMFHAILSAPYVQYSVLPPTQPSPASSPSSETSESPVALRNDRRLVNADVPGIVSPKMMHDFGVGRSHTVIMDLPLSLDPRNMMRGKPQVYYDPTAKSRFGVFPRYEPGEVRWFETKACCVFHTANTWTTTTHSSLLPSPPVSPDIGKDGAKDVETNIKEFGASPPREKVHLLACRLTSAGIVFTTGDIIPPPALDILDQDPEEEQCRLYYYQFDLSTPPGGFPPNQPRKPTYEFALSAVAFEFPTIPLSTSMSESRYIFGTSTALEKFDPTLASKIDCLVKMDVLRLIESGISHYGKPGGVKPVIGCADSRNALQVLEDNERDGGEGTGGSYSIQIFRFPPGYYGQECRFVARESPDGEGEEDDGWLLCYVFDESQLVDGKAYDGVDISAKKDTTERTMRGHNGQLFYEDELPKPKVAKSELWIIDAKDMRTVVAKIRLPQRVPYGLHGSWFSKEEVENQRDDIINVRTIPTMGSREDKANKGLWNGVRKWILERLA